MKPFGRSLSDFAPFRPAEMRLLESCGRGEVAVIANGRPLVSTPANTVRAPFLRFLLLGGDERAPVHENGVQLQGAWIEEVLELRYVNVVHALDFRYCTFTDCPGFMETCFAHSVSLNGCCLPGLDAVGARVAGSVYLRGGFESTEVLRLDEMQIDGQLSCGGASLNVKAGVAMSADRIVVKGGMFLDDGFKSAGEIRLLGAHIDVQLNCSNGTFDGFNGDALSADGAVVNGSVKLNQGFKAKGEVRLAGMRISGELNLSGADLDGKSTGAMFANGIQVGGNVLFGSAFHSIGEVKLLGARIGANLVCSDCNFDGQGGKAFSCDGLAVAGNVFLRDGFKAQGEVRFLGAQIQGQLSCSDATFDGQTADALSVDGATVRGDINLLNGFTSLGTVRLSGVQIGGQLSCSGGKFDGNGGRALHADGAVVAGAVFLCHGFEAKGPVGMLGVQIGGQLNCSGATFDRRNCGSLSDGALSADGLVVKSNVLLNDGFKAFGSVRLPGAQIGGQLSCRSACIDAKPGVALLANGVTVTGSVLLDGGFRAWGMVQLGGARIDGRLICRGGSFDGADGDALLVDSAAIKGDVLLSDGFQAMGAVRLSGAQIGGKLECSGASFDARVGQALFANDLHVVGPLALRCMALPLRNASFSGAIVAALDDDGSSWGGGVDIDGFVYTHLAGGASMTASQRIAWLSGQATSITGPSSVTGENSNFRPQPWRQLIRVLEGMGRTEDARQIGIEFEHRLRRAGLIGQPPMWCPVRFRRLSSLPARALHCAYFLLTGYGYRPVRLVGWSLGVWLLCAATYWYAAARVGVFAPSNPLVFQNDAYLECRPDREAVWREKNGVTKGDKLTAAPVHFRGVGNWYLCEALREEYTGLSPLAFSLDVLLPLVDLQQQHDWAPLIPTPVPDFASEFTAFGWKYFVRIVIWLETLFGWAVSVLLVAVVSGLARRRD